MGKEIVVDNLRFPFDTGVRLLKLKYGNDCIFGELEDFWDDIVQRFKLDNYEIDKLLKNNT